MAERPKENQNFLGGSDEQKDEQHMKFPRKLRHRNKGKVLARIYHAKGSKHYTLYWRFRDISGKLISGASTIHLTTQS